MDYIRLKNLEFFAYHGLKPQEAADGQRFEVDLELAYDTSKAALSDDINDTINYEDIYHITAQVLLGERQNLLEALANTIADRIQSAYPTVHLKVIVRKPDAPLPGAHKGVEVEINR